MSSFRVMPRAYRRQLEAEDLANVNRAVGQVYDEAYGPEAPRKKMMGPAGGDTRRLRGIPAIGRGVPGAIRDTRPGDSLR